MADKKYKAQNAVENYANLRIAFKKIFADDDAEKNFFENAEEKLGDLLLEKSGEAVEAVAFYKGINPDDYEFDAESFFVDFMNAYMLFKVGKKDFLSEQMKKNQSSGSVTATTGETETI